MFRKVATGSTSRLTIVDHSETYGRHVLEKTVKKLEVSLALDIGCGQGDDLMIVKNNHPNSKCIGVDYGDWNREKLTERGIESVAINIENQKIPLDEETVDLVIANQVLEHTKEIYWINHEIFRTLKVGGYLYLGVPNVLSLHNRVLGLLGTHPTSSKLISAHVRVFSKNDTFLFYRELASNFAEIDGFYGSQFYPFPKTLARPLASLFPSQAFSIFFVVKKTAKYNGEFIKWLSSHVLETNFYSGEQA